MRIFVIHSGSDRTFVKEKIDEIAKKTTGSEFLMLKNGGKFWKIDAKNMIKMSQLVLVFVGENSFKSPNIAWEINAAQKANKKIITILLNENYELPPSLFHNNKFTREKEKISDSKSIDEVISVINTFSNGDYALFNTAIKDLDYDVLIEQYKIFLQTSENLVERRQGVNNFYISVNSALVAAFSIISALGQNLLVKCFIGFVFSCIGIILCLSWIRIINSYGLLNASKMKIISLLEKRLPASLYDAEWRAQSDKLNSRPYISFTECETQIPKIFIGVYIVIAVLVIAFLLHGSV